MTLKEKLINILKNIRNFFVSAWNKLFGSKSPAQTPNPNLTPPNQVVTPDIPAVKPLPPANIPEVEDPLIKKNWDKLETLLKADLGMEKGRKIYLYKDKDTYGMSFMTLAKSEALLKLEKLADIAQGKKINLDGMFFNVSSFTKEEMHALYDKYDLSLATQTQRPKSS